MNIFNLIICKKSPVSLLTLQVFFFFFFFFFQIKYFHQKNQLKCKDKMNSRKLVILLVLKDFSNLEFALKYGIGKISKT